MRVSPMKPVLLPPVLPPITTPRPVDEPITILPVAWPPANGNPGVVPPWLQSVR